MKVIIKKIIFSLIRLLTIKNNKYLIFESSEYFFDNSYSLYLYIREKMPNYRIKYIVTNSEQYFYYKQYLNSKKEVLYLCDKLFSAKLLRYSLKSKAIFYCYYNYWKSFKIPHKTPIVFLNHGEFPVKRIDHYLDFLFKGSHNNDYRVFTTDYGKHIFEKEYPILKNVNCIVSGMPRNDELFKNRFFKSDLLRVLNYTDTANPHIVLFMTTFRKMYEENINFFKDEFPLRLKEHELRDLNELARKNNTILLFKTHRAQIKCDILSGKSNILFLDNSTMQKEKILLHSIYPLCDALITDYSSSYQPFLLLNRKVAFITADMAKYNIERGFTIDNIEDIMPGDKINTYDDLCNFIKNCLDYTNDPWNKKRKQIAELLVGSKTDDNCERVASAFLGLK